MPGLFDDVLPHPEGAEEWKKEWKNMPEFTQNNMDPKFTIQVNFETEEDLYAFAKLVGQKITFKTPSIWYPQATVEKVINKKWVDSNES